MTEKTERRLGVGASRRLLGNGWKKRDAIKHAADREMDGAPMIRVPKYGIPFHRIRYWQGQAWDLYRLNGIYSGRAYFDSANLYKQSASTIGHAIISLAAVASPEHVKAVLDDTRGRRWQ